MKSAEFYKIVKRLYDPLLEPFGFQLTRARDSIYHRQVSDKVFHFILLDRSSHGTWYDIRVFPSSPLLQPDWIDSIPRALGITTDMNSYLDPVTGVGGDQRCFRCESEGEMLESFEQLAKRAVVEKAIPFLDDIQSMHDMAPLMRTNRFRALALFHSGEVAAATPMLEAELLRLEELEQAPIVLASISQIRALLESVK